MNKLKLIGLAALLASVLSGCAVFSKQEVPATRIAFNPKTKAIEVVSPKQFHADGISLSLATNGTYVMSVTNLSSTNDAAITAALFQMQSEMAKSYVQSMNALIQLGQTVATKAP